MRFPGHDPIGAFCEVFRRGETGNRSLKRGYFTLRRVLSPEGSRKCGVRQWCKWGWSTIDVTNLRNRLKKICSGEMLNFMLNAGRGFHPPRCGSPDAITPEQVLRHHRWAQGRHGGTGSCPLLPPYQHLEFHIYGKGILQSRIFFLGSAELLFLWYTLQSTGYEGECSACPPTLTLHLAIMT